MEILLTSYEMLEELVIVRKANFCETFPPRLKPRCVHL